MNDHHGNSLNRVVTLADFITPHPPVKTNGSQDGEPTNHQARIAVIAIEKDPTTVGPCIADCASFNLLPIDIKGCAPSARLQLKLLLSRSRRIQRSQGKN